MIEDEVGTLSSRCYFLYEFEEPNSSLYNILQLLHNRLRKEEEIFSLKLMHDGARRWIEIFSHHRTRTFIIVETVVFTPAAVPSLARGFAYCFTNCAFFIFTRI